MIHSFLLVGQSNMAGRGLLEEAPPVSTKKIKILRNGRWVDCYRPINNDRSFSGYSLAETFAEDYLKEHPDVEVGLIPCADGGTSLDQWRVGGLLFDNAIYQCKLAERTSTIAGVLWHQGEADCSPELYPLYKQKFELIMSAFREKLDLSDVPFLLGGLGDYLCKCKIHEDLDNYHFINQQLKVLAEQQEMVGYINAENLTSKDDFLHFNTKSLIEFGHRYYNVFKSLEKKDKIFKEKSDMDSAIRTQMELL